MRFLQHKIDGLIGCQTCPFAGISGIKSRFFAVTMTANPFRAKAEERAKLCKKDEDDTERPAKRMCNQYEKQMAKMSGDLR